MVGIVNISSRYEEAVLDLVCVVVYTSAVVAINVHVSNTIVIVTVQPAINLKLMLQNHFLKPCISCERCFCYAILG